MRELVPSKGFLKDLARMKKRGSNLFHVNMIIEYLRTHGQAETRCRPHKLEGEWAGYWECHIGFDWLLIYTVDAETVNVWRTGTHDDLFG